MINENQVFLSIGKHIEHKERRKQAEVECLRNVGSRTSMQELHSQLLQQL